MERLRLEVRQFESLERWRWQLAREDSGEALADHEVDLTGAGWELGAFENLHEYLRWNAVPDRRIASEAQILAQVGDWAGRAVLGEEIGAALAAAAPASVRVVLPPEAAFLLSWPLELAHAAGQPLAARGDVTLVYDLAGRASHAGARGSRAGNGARTSLRMLAVFSLPTRSEEHTSELQSHVKLVCS